MKRWLMKILGWGPRTRLSVDVRFNGDKQWEHVGVYDSVTEANDAACIAAARRCMETGEAGVCQVLIGRVR